MYTAVLQSTVVIPSQCQQCDITQQTGYSQRKWEHCSITKKSGGPLSQHPQSSNTKHTGNSKASLESVVLQRSIVGHTAHVNNVLLKKQSGGSPSQCEQCTISKRVVFV